MSESTTMTRWLRLVGFVAVLIGIFLLGSHHDSIIDAVLSSRTWILAHGTVGIATYFVLVVVLLQLMMPTTTFELFAGFLFGFKLGAVVICSAEVVASAIQFFLARWVFTESVAEMLKDKPLWFVLRSLVKKGVWRAVIFLRLAYVPLPLKNYCLAALPVVPLPVFLGSMLVSEIPVTLIVTYIGSTLESIAEIKAGGKKGDPTQIALLCFLVTANLLLGMAMAWATREEMKRVEAERAGVDADGQARREPLLAA